MTLPEAALHQTASERTLRKVRPAHAALALAALWVLVGGMCLKGYGLTIDSPALFYAGDRTLFWLEHPTVPGALDLKGADPPGFNSSFGRFPVWEDPLHYPVLPGLFAAITSQILHERLHWMTLLDGHHLGLLLFSGIGLFFYCFYGITLLGPAAGIAATIVLMLFPTAVGGFINNAKDWPAGLWYGVAVLAGGVGAIRGQARHIWAAYLLIGVSLACKFNGIFALATLLIWAPMAFLILYRRRRELSAQLVAACLGGPYLSLGSFILLWPWMYQGGPAEAWSHFSEYVHYMVAYGVGPRATFVAYPFLVLAFMTPPLVLAGASAFVAFGWRGGRERLAVWSLLLIWLAVPILRIALPHSNFFDANRHFIEYVPALAAVGGAGLVSLCQSGAQWLAGLSVRRGLPDLTRALIVGASMVAMAALLWPVLEYHPFEVAYFNSFIGGLGGAQRRALFFTPPPHDSRVNGTEGDYWYSSLRHALRSIYPQAKAGETIAACNRWIGPQLIRDWPGPNEPELADTRSATYVYASPRVGGDCGWAEINELEADRPVLARVERGGGLIYELFGPRRALPPPGTGDPKPPSRP